MVVPQGVSSVWYLVIDRNTNYLRVREKMVKSKYAVMAPQDKTLISLNDHTCTFSNAMLSDPTVCSIAVRPV